MLTGPDDLGADQDGTAAFITLGTILSWPEMPDKLTQLPVSNRSRWPWFSRRVVIMIPLASYLGKYYGSLSKSYFRFLLVTSDTTSFNWKANNETIKVRNGNYYTWAHFMLINYPWENL